MKKNTRDILPFFIRKALTIIMLTGCISNIFAQSENEVAGDDAFSQGWYKTALYHYKNAIVMQSHSNELLYKIAESARLANDYQQAITYYNRLISNNGVFYYPDIQFYLAEMYKSNGDNDSALVCFERYVRSFSNNTELTQRAKEEISACRRILNDSLDILRREYDIKHEGKNFNTENSESGAVMIEDSVVLFATIKEINTSQSDNSIFENFVLQQICQVNVKKNGNFSGSKLNRWGLNSHKKHTGNVAYDAVNQCVYFTYADVNSFADIQCNIYVSHFVGGKWSTPKRLSSRVNVPGFTSTQPTVAHKDGNTLLLYSSNRPGGSGGMDIWYSIVNGDDVSKSVNLGAPVNTPGDEITPFYCDRTGELYFSSDYHHGYGGYDVFVSRGFRDQWSEPQNLGASLNSPANDIYFTVNKNDTLAGFLTSNRKGSYFIADNTCCNDIYTWKRHADSVVPQPLADSVPEITLQSTARSLLPITLYFHNDEPDPRSKKVTTQQTYFQTYFKYLDMKSLYKSNFRKMDDEGLRNEILMSLDSFFDSTLPANYSRLDSLFEIIVNDLQHGHNVKLLVKGFASPLATDEYNFILSKRRISSFINQLLEYDNNLIHKYLQTSGNKTGSLQIEELALGSSMASDMVSADASDQQKSVFSPEAIAERRIEILDYQYSEEEDRSCLKFPANTISLGKFRANTENTVPISFPIGCSEKDFIINYLNIASPNVRLVQNSKTVTDGKLNLKIKIDTKGIGQGNTLFIPFTIRVNNESRTQTIFLEYSVE